MSLEANKATPDPGVRQQIFEQIHQLYLITPSDAEESTTKRKSSESDR
jgi:hypothetical protein